MIDWLTVQVPISHVQINDGMIVNYDRDNKPIYAVDKRLKLTSSHETTIQIRSSGTRNFDGFFSHLTVDGNLNKYFNGHNIVGTDDPVYLLSRFIREIIEDGTLILNKSYLSCIRHKDKPYWLEQIEWGNFELKRIDINYMFKVNGGDVSEYIDFLSDTTRTRFSRTTQPGSGSVYWNQKSTHWSMKAYDKHKEMNARKKSHRLPEHWPETVKEKIHEIVKPYVRFELVLRSRKLKEIAQKLGYNRANWEAFCEPVNDENKPLKKVTPAELFQTFFEKIEVSTMERYQVDKAIDVLSLEAYATFSAWRSGHNVMNKLSTRTYYRHRKEIIQNLGVDIKLSNIDVERHKATAVKVFKLVANNDQVIQKQLDKLLKAS